MKKVLKWFFGLLLIVFVVIQFFRPKANAHSGASTMHLSKLYSIPENAATVYTKACADCHSDNTVYPWYSKVQPVAWWLDEHVVDGKKHFNIDSFAAYKLRKQYHKMEEIIDMVKKKEMPLESYTWVHSEAKLTDDERVALTGWATAVMDSMKAHYPIDSLVRKKK
jgi:hypothetical protein